jgi:hypothetical protein
VKKKNMSKTIHSDRASKTKRQDEKTYAELLYESKDASEKVAKVYVRQLCEALKRENYPHIDPEDSSVEKIYKMCNDIKAKVIHDCTWWGLSSIQHSWPDWIKDEYYVDLRKARTEKEKLKAVANIATQEQKSTLEDKKEFNLVGSVIHDIKLPKITLEEPPESTPIPEGEEIATGKEFGPTPIELYEQTVKALEKVWIPLTGQEHLIATASDDIILHHVKPTRKIRVKLMKGLDESRRIHLRNCAIWVKAILEDIVRIDDDTFKAEGK